MRIRFAAGAVVCALLLGFGYYLQYVQGLDPCPLCQVQRAFYYLVGICVRRRRLFMDTRVRRLMARSQRCSPSAA